MQSILSCSWGGLLTWRKGFRTGSPRRCMAAKFFARSCTGAKSTVSSTATDSGAAVPSYCHESTAWEAHVGSFMHGRSECHLVDKVRIGLLSWPHAHGALQHPGAAEARVVRIDSRQRLLVERIRLHHMSVAEARAACSPFRPHTGVRMRCFSACVMICVFIASEESKSQLAQAL